jgi:aminoglycoside phosphotransferase (APT) family kinase protein
MTASDQPVLIPVLSRHRFDEAALDLYLRQHLSAFAGLVQVEQFQGGQSNPTFRLTAQDGRFWVLRKKPPGTLLPSAHQIDREFKVLDALGRVGVPVPKVHLWCESPTIIGSSFYIMDYLQGRVLTDVAMVGYVPEQRTAHYQAMVTCLADLHAVDWRAIGLEGFGKTDRYIARQIERWSQQFIAAKGDATIPAMDRLMTWLPRNMPSEDTVALTHGDYRLGNLMFAPGDPNVLAILDWELSTLGHPLADLAYNCMPYHLPAGSTEFPGLLGLGLAELGIPDESTYVATYCQRAGRGRIDDWAFYLAFSFFRIASICQGVYARALSGNAADRKATAYGEVARMAAETGWRFISDQS